jgi:hypothetical protein
MKINQLMMIAAVVSIGAFTSCKKEGCIDVNANNYNVEAEKDDESCVYPSVNMTAGGLSGDISGAGGTVTGSSTFTQTSATLGWDMSQNASSGSFNLTVTDASGNAVINNTITAGVGAQDAGGTSSSGTTGTWTVTVTLTSYTGSGDYSIQ